MHVNAIDAMGPTAPELHSLMWGALGTLSCLENWVGVVVADRNRVRVIPSAFTSASRPMNCFSTVVVVVCKHGKY